MSRIAPPLHAGAEPEPEDEAPALHGAWPAPPALPHHAAPAAHLAAPPQGSVTGPARAPRLPPGPRAGGALGREAGGQRGEVDAAGGERRGSEGATVE
jgi:hypothetical protein